MQVIPQDNTWIEALIKWNQAELQNKALNQQQLANEVEWARQTGNKPELEKRLGYKVDVYNPMYKQAPEVQPLAKILSQLQTSGGQETVLGGGTPKLPGDFGKFGEFEKNTKTGEVKQTSTRVSDTKVEANALENLLKTATARAAIPGAPSLQDVVSQMSNPDKPYQSPTSGYAAPAMQSLIPAAKAENKAQETALEKWKSNPKVNQMYLKNPQAGELMNTMVDNFYEAIQGKSPQEIAKLYTQTRLGLRDVGQTFYRRDAANMLGSLGSWMPTGGGGVKMEKRQAKLDPVLYKNQIVPYESPYPVGSQEDVALAIQQAKNLGIDAVKPEHIKAVAAYGTSFGPNINRKELEELIIQRQSEIKDIVDEANSMPDSTPEEKKAKISKFEEARNMGAKLNIYNDKELFSGKKFIKAEITGIDRKAAMKYKGETIWHKIPDIYNENSVQSEADVYLKSKGIK